MAMVTEPLPARRRGEPRRRGRGWCRWAGRGMRHVALYFIVCTPISYLVGRERIFDDVTANNSNEYVTIKVDRHVVLAYT